MKTQKEIEKKQADLLKKINEILGENNRIIKTTIDLKNEVDNPYTHINFYLKENRSLILGSHQFKQLAKLNLKLYFNCIEPHFYYTIFN